MNHKPFLDWMQAALDGDIASTQRRDLAEHLAACASCQALCGSAGAEISVEIERAVR